MSPYSDPNCMKDFKFPLRIVVLDYPIKHWEDPEVREFFTKIVGLKIEGYWGHFTGAQMLPIDQTDLVGTNFAICYETPDGLIPIMACRSVDSKRCDHHRITFPAKTILETSGQSTDRLLAILEAARHNNRSICYKSSWTKSESAPNTPEAVEFLRNMFTMTLVNYTRQLTDEWICCGAVKWKVDRFLKSIGLAPITDIFQQFSFFDNDAIMFHMKGKHAFTPMALEVTGQLQHYWDNRIVLGEGAVVLPKKIAV